MARPCSVCHHPEREGIDELLVAGTAYRDIAKRATDSGWDPVSTSALSRHKQDHLSPSLVKIMTDRQDDLAGGLVDQLHALLGRVHGILEAAGDRPATALAAVREARSLIESIGKFTGELDERPQVNVINLTASPEWLEVQTRILRALMPYPAARIAVADALDVDDSPKALP